MRIDFERKYDAVIIGGGVAGVAAAISAAESGVKTALIEKSCMLGGLATMGMVYFYLPICDGRGTQVGFGLTEKLMHASVKYGPQSFDFANWKNNIKNLRYRTIFSPASFILAMEEMLLEKGIEIWYDSTFCAIEKNSAGNSELIIRNKGGNGRFYAKVVIDATGDAEVARECGCDFVQGENTLAFWSIENDEDNHEELWSRCGNTKLKGLINGRVRTEQLPYHALDPEGVSKYIIESRNWAREVYSASDIDFSKRFPVLIPSMADFRTAAKIKGKFTIPHNTHNTRFDDSIGMAADWGSVGTVQEIPYSAMIPEKGDNIIVAGRCISAENYSWELIRSIPAVAVTGEAAGVAAALAISNDVSCGALDYKLLQNKLYDRGCKLHLSDVALPYRGEKGYTASTLKFETH